MIEANPVLVEVTRGNWVENRHRGAFCVMDASGGSLASGGDIDRPVFPRSAIKSMQALAMFRSGAVEKFGLDSSDIALACASHLAEPGHVEGVARFLEKIGCTIADLECGAHPPTGPVARKVLRQSGETPSAIHNNCSGKHTGMLAVAKALGAPTKGYSTREHPVQQMVREGVEAVIGETLTTDKCGIDGCSIPTWAAPLRAFALGFARMATGEGLPEDIAKASAQTFEAATGNPFLVRGTETLDTDLMSAFKGRLMIKIGADGVFCGALRDRGLGFALKIDDGNIKAAETLVASLLLDLAQPNDEERKALETWATYTLTNWRKFEVGKMTASAAARPTAL